MCYFWKKIYLQELNYWNVDLQKHIFRLKKLKEKEILDKNNLFPSIMRPNPLTGISQNHFF